MRPLGVRHGAKPDAAPHNAVHEPRNGSLVAWMEQVTERQYRIGRRRSTG
jgi:hypothetical protein